MLADLFCSAQPFCRTGTTRSGAWVEAQNLGPALPMQIPDNSSAGTDALVYPVLIIGQVDDTTKADRGTAIQPWPHQEEFCGEPARQRAAIGVPD